MVDDAASRQILLAHQLRWLDLLDAYAAEHAEEHDVVACFRELMSTDAYAASRERREGHLTGSAWLVGADGSRVLLTHHRKLDRWLQLGGHADGDADLARVALREAQEESGLGDLLVEPAIFDLDRHVIPARRAEPEHWHYDVRFVVHACGGETYSVSEESHALAWVDIATIAGDREQDESLRRMARRWLARPMSRRGAGSV